MKRTLLFLACASAAWGQCPVSYTAQRSITVNNGQVTGTLSGYPMLVLNPTSGLANPNNLKTTANGGRVTSANGYDIIFVNGGGTLLPFEMVRHGQANTTYDPTTGNAEFHVSVASIADGTKIYMCYGNSAVTTYQGNDGGTWDNNYEGVWHLSNGTGLSPVDSTSNSNNGVLSASNPTATAGKVDGAAAFSGTSQYITIGDAASLHTVGDFSIQAWLKPNSIAGYNGIFSRSSATAMPFPYDTYLKNSTGVPRIILGNNSGDFTPANFYMLDGNTAVSAGVWTKIDFTKSGNTVTIYRNGVSDATGTNTANLVDSGLASRIGTRESLDTMMNGSIDEVRLSNIARPAGWIATEYKNQNSPATFYAVGSETAPGVSTTMSAVPAAIPNGHAANITLTLTGAGTNWSNASTVFTIAGVSNVTKVSQNVTSATAATLVVRTAAGTGSLNISETVTGSASTAIAVAVPSFSIDVVRGNLSSVQTLLLTGTNTVWSQEAAGLLSVAGGLGASIGTPAISTDTTGTVQLTVGTLAGPLTITDASTGKTATFAAGGAAGPSGCAVVLAQ